MSPLQIFARKKQSQTPLAMIALSDAPSAQIACDAGIDALLVGDSLGNTALGFDSTIPVTMDDIAHHLNAVLRGVKSSSRPDVPVIADMPFGSYATPETGVKNAVRLMQLGAHAVKIEGTQAVYSEAGRVFNLCELAGIPVMGHLGFTPQSSLQFAGIVQGKTAKDAKHLLDDALRLARSGCFALVLEAMTTQVAREITSQLKIPTVGIGAGQNCDGQVLVWHDLVGITAKPFKMARAFASTREVWTSAIQTYCGEVAAAGFPNAQNSWEMSAEESEKWAQNLADGYDDEDPFAGDEFNDSDPFAEPREKPSL